MGQLVAGRAKHIERRVGIGELGLLQRQHVRPGPLEPPHDLIQPSLEGVHVPGGDPHAERYSLVRSGHQGGTAAPRKPPTSESPSRNPRPAYLPAIPYNKIRPMPELLGRLQSALSDRYRLDREVGAGGMATVYLAEDVRHDRRAGRHRVRPERAAAVWGARLPAAIKPTPDPR